MDAKKLQLQEKIENLLRQASTVASEIQAIDQGNETPHFDQIELPANALGEESQFKTQFRETKEGSPQTQAQAYSSYGFVEHQKLECLTRTAAGEPDTQ